MRIIPIFLALAFAILPTVSQSTGDQANSPCGTGSDQMYPHRRSLSPRHERRQFVGMQVIPGQGTNAPPPPPLVAKYIISQAVVKQGPVYTNGTNTIVAETFSILVANATDGSTPITCSINWNPPGVANTGYPMTCQDGAFCAVLTQQSQAVADGFYLYVSLPNAPKTTVAWMVKHLEEVSDWKQAEGSSPGLRDWIFNGVAALKRMPGQSLGDFVKSGNT